ncbi:MAG: hypothetical protein ACLFRO_07795 [Desulfobacterales bacterium]
MNDTALNIAEKIKARLQDGIRLEKDVLHYIESVTGAAKPDDLLSQLEQGEESCEIESLYELIFYPDEDDQVFLEPLLEEKAVDQKTAEYIRWYLAKEEIRTRLFYPNGSMTPEITVPGHSINQYLKRLRLTSCIPEKTAEAIRANISDRQLALRMRVRLRNAEFGYSGNAASFICSCLEKMPVKSEEDMARIQWVIDFLGRRDEGTDIYSSLMEEKRRAAEMLRLSSESEQRLSRQPVEALIMQGVNIPCISTDETIRQLNIIDQIALAVFGTTETPDRQTPVNLGVFDGKSDIGKVIRILS